MTNHSRPAAADSAAKEQLIIDCQGLVRSLAKQIRSTLPEWVDLEDLVGYGQLGLVQAAKDFDASRGVKFSTFAYYRIRGAIFDGVNKVMWFKSTRNPESKYNQMADSLLEESLNEQSSTANEDLVSQASWFTSSVKALAVCYLTSMDAEQSTPEIKDQSAKSPWSGIVQSETHEKLNQAINQLAPEAAALIRAVYYNEQSLQDAAHQLKISKSWASRVHARALEQLARAMERES